MPYYEKSEDWLKQSSLLIEAHPVTVRSPLLPLNPSTNELTNKLLPTQQTKITTTYSVKPSTKPTSTESKPHGHLVLKTYDPISGSCLKYKTVKAAEVSRLIQMLGTLGKKMAGLPDAPEDADEVMADAPPPTAAEAVEGSGTSTPAPPAVAAPAPGGGAKGKKKKGKR